MTAEQSRTERPWLHGALTLLTTLVFAAGPQLWITANREAIWAFFADYTFLFGGRYDRDGISSGGIIWVSMFAFLSGLFLVKLSTGWLEKPRASMGRTLVSYLVVCSGYALATVCCYGFYWAASWFLRPIIGAVLTFLPPDWALVVLGLGGIGAGFLAPFVGLMHLASWGLKRFGIDLDAKSKT